MSTHRVRPGSSITELLQALSVGPGKSKPSSLDQRGMTGARSPGRLDPAALRHDLAVLAAGVDLDSAIEVLALRRPVARRILLSEFGESFLEHPDFQGTLASIEAAMEEDPTVPAKFQAMLKQLRDEGST